VADSPTPTTAAVGTTKSPSEAAVLLVTGFPGLRARALVRQALGVDAELRPLLLVHPERLERAMGVLSSLPGGERARLVGGDPAAIDFGLGRTDYARLAEEVRVVHHVYQVIDLAAPGEVAEAVNVGGAREMIELCRVAKKLERVVHYSSVFVSGDRTGIVLERDLHSHQSFRSPVAASLALAEAAGVLPETLGETLHLVDPRPLTTRRLLELAAARFGKLLAPGFNPGVLGSLINNPGVGLLAQQLRAVGDLITRDVTYDDATATARLAPNGIRCPPLESYLDVLLAHVEARAHDKGSMRPKEPADVVG
jgi:hypothetical protein